MTRLFLAAGVAALAIAMPASAKPGDGDRGGKGGGHAAAATNHGGGGGKARAHAGGGRGGGEVRADFGRGGGKMRAAERRGGSWDGARAQRHAFASSDRGKGRGAAVQVDHGRGHAARLSAWDRRGEKAERAQQRRAERREFRAERRDDRVERIRHADKRVFNRDLVRDNRLAERIALRDQIRPERLVRVGTRDWDDRDRWDRGFSRGFIEGCPPGLWMKGNGCLPPGQAKKLIGNTIPVSLRAASLPLALSPFYRDTDDHYWRYDDGYLYQVDRTSNIVASLLPLIGGGYVPGMMFPTSYSPYYQSGNLFPNYYGNSYVPDYYGFNAFYPDTPNVDYRYLNGNIYGVDPYSGLIEDVIPTYAYGYGVGQVLPAGYGYYNVPMDYRSLYYDTPDNNYWYAPGAIYQVDPTSQLITAVASLLAPGMSIGQPLPMGYDVYNVPYAYRQTYYDTPDAWYRYNNGNIYQIDPTTRLVTAIVASLLT